MKGRVRLIAEFRSDRARRDEPRRNGTANLFVQRPRINGCTRRARHALITSRLSSNTGEAANNNEMDICIADDGRFVMSTVIPGQGQALNPESR